MGKICGRQLQGCLSRDGEDDMAKFWDISGEVGMETGVVKTKSTN